MRAYAELEVLKTVLMKIHVFWNVKPRRLVNTGFFKSWQCEDACKSEQAYTSSALTPCLRRSHMTTIATRRYIPTCFFRIGVFFNSRKSTGIALHILHASIRRLVSCLKTPPNLLKSIIQSICLCRYIAQSTVDMAGRTWVHRPRWGVRILPTDYSGGSGPIPGQSM
jgi:hypothetical protein